MSTIKFLMLVVGVTVSTSAGAHEFWIEPATFIPKAAQPLRVTLKQGERFAGTVVPYRKARVVRYELIEGQKTQSVRGRDGKESVFARPSSNRAAWLRYESVPKPHRLPAPRFTAYLRAERLDSVIAERERRGETDREGLELFQRCAKSILSAPDGSFVDRALGLDLEIVLDRGADRASGVLSGQLLFRGKPLVKARVVAVERAEPGKLYELTTDAEGRFRGPKAGAGAWMLTALHMIRIEGDPRAEWKSFWGSVTFERRSVGKAVAEKPAIR